MQLEVNGARWILSKTVSSRAVVLWVSKLAWTMGYTNASWTLKRPCRRVCVSAAKTCVEDAVTPMRQAPRHSAVLLDLASDTSTRLPPSQGSGAPWRALVSKLRPRTSDCCAEERVTGSCTPHDHRDRGRAGQEPSRDPRRVGRKNVVISALCTGLAPDSFKHQQGAGRLAMSTKINERRSGRRLETQPTEPPDAGDRRSRTSRADRAEQAGAMEPSTACLVMWLARPPSSTVMAASSRRPPSSMMMR